MFLMSEVPLYTQTHIHAGGGRRTEEMRWAKKALATSLVSSADQTFVHLTRSSGTQCAYTLARAATAASPAAVWYSETN